MVFWVKFPLRRNIVAQESWPQPTLASSFFEFCQPPWYWKNQQYTAGASPVSPLSYPHTYCRTASPPSRTTAPPSRSRPPTTRPGRRAAVCPNPGLLGAEVTNSRGCHKWQQISCWQGRKTPWQHQHIFVQIVEPQRHSCNRILRTASTLYYGDWCNKSFGYCWMDIYQVFSTKEIGT